MKPTSHSKANTTRRKISEKKGSSNTFQCSFLFEPTAIPFGLVGLGYVYIRRFQRFFLHFVPTQRRFRKKSQTAWYLVHSSRGCTHPVPRVIEVSTHHTQLAKMGFDQTSDLTAQSHLHFFLKELYSTRRATKAPTRWENTQNSNIHACYDGVAFFCQNIF